MSGRLSIAQVTPFALEAPGEVGHQVDRISRELGARGHSVVVIGPSESAGLVRDSRRTIRAARDDPSKLLEKAEFDIVHVHEPFAPSASAAALRHSRALNVGSFHDPTERELSGQLTRPLARLLFGRLDARTAGSQVAADLMGRFFPGEYRVVTPGADLPGPSSDRDHGKSGPVRIAMVADEERAALRTFIRALRALPDEPDWQATVFSSRPLAAPAGLARRLRERMRFELTGSEADVLAAADVVVLASDGARPVPGLAMRAIAAGAVPVASRLAVYEEVLGEGRRGLVFEPGDVETLAAHLRRLVADPALRTRLAEGAQDLRETLSWSRVADELEQIYEPLARRRHDRRADPALRKRLGKRPLIDVDLHMHTDHSYDCATPVEVLLAEARARGLGAIAITDHNEISGAHEARAKADGVKVIVAEEVKTADQGEVIGLFIEDKIERGMTLQETIAEIKRQGGLVYVPHPFDRMHSVPDYEHLLDVLDDVDAIEVFNPRVAITEFNEEAVRFAAKYRIPAGAGSDAHVPQGLGSVRIRMRDFDGPEEFLESLRDADIIRNPASLLYVQALKFLQTRALPSGARRASRERRVRRATR